MAGLALTDDRDINFDVIFEETIRALSRQINHGGGSLDMIPRTVKHVLGDNEWRAEMWRKRHSDLIDETIEFESFEQFVTTDLPRGLGCSIERLKHLCFDDTEALDAIDKALRKKPGKRKRDPDIVPIGHNKRLGGNTRDRALRMLRDKRPDLHKRVLAGELSPHAAMIEAGFRKKTFTVPDDIKLAAKALARHFGPAFALALADEIEAVVTSGGDDE
jgi:hypothetical protein